MKEGIAGRVARIISGSVNALIDAVENAAPAVMMEETIREIDAAIDEVRSELKEISASRRMADTRLMEENSKCEDLAEKVAVAVADGRDDLATYAISQQLDIEAQLPILERTIFEAKEREKELEGYLLALQAKKREMREELQNYLSARSQAAEDPGGVPSELGPSGASAKVAKKAETASSGFQRILERHTGLPNSSSSPDKEGAAQLAELEELAHKDRVKERLLAAKGKQKG